MIYLLMHIIGTYITCEFPLDDQIIYDIWYIISYVHILSKWIIKILTSGASSPLMIRSCKRIQRSVPARTSCLQVIRMRVIRMQVIMMWVIMLVIIMRVIMRRVIMMRVIMMKNQRYPLYQYKTYIFMSSVFAKPLYPYISISSYIHLAGEVPILSVQ